MKTDKIFPDVANIANAEVFAYFAALQDGEPGREIRHTAEKWNQRAMAWKKERDKNQKGDERVNSAVEFLSERGLLRSDFDVVDIGCGPGRFVAAFAKESRSALGLDLSEKMIEHGMEHIRDAEVENARLSVCDFQTLDIDAAGYRGAFDLVFSSMTPAIHGMNGLKKSIEMSRAWCCQITSINSYDYLRERILQEVFGAKAWKRWDGRWFYSLFNVLFLMGYNPETSYDKRHQERWIRPDEEFAESVMEHGLPEKEANKENAAKIMDWLLRHQNEDGLVQEISDSVYGRIIWDVRERSERAEYGDERLTIKSQAPISE